MKIIEAVEMIRATPGKRAQRLAWNNSKYWDWREGTENISSHWENMDGPVDTACLEDILAEDWVTFTVNPQANGPYKPITCKACQQHSPPMFKYRINTLNVRLCFRCLEKVYKICNIEQEDIQ